MRPLPISYKESLEIAVAAYELQIHRAGEYLRARGLSPSTAERFRMGVVVDPHSGHEAMTGRLVIPSIGPNGIYQLKFRCIQMHDCKEIGHSKYLTDAHDNRLFNVRAIVEAQNVICITEGEIDAITLEQIGYKAVAAPGSNTWRKHHARMFAGFQRVYLFGDGDKAGRDFVKSVGETLPNAVRLTFDDGDDINQVYTRDGAGPILELMGITGAESNVYRE